MRRLLHGARRSRIVRTVLRFLFIRYHLARERLTTGVSYNPLSPRLHADPYPIYRRLREKDPVHRSRLMAGWVLSKHEDIDAVLRDHGRFISDPRQFDDYTPLERGPQAPSLIGLDPPDHTRLRSLVNRAFTPRAVEAMRSRVEQIVDELLERVDGRECFDVIDALANPLPTIVIAEMLGVPSDDRDRFQEWSDDVARTLEPTITPQQREAANRSAGALRDYFNEIIEQRRAEPRDDLISALVAAEEEGDRLTHEELLTTLTLLLVAGNETTTNLIGNGLLALLRHPDQMARLRDDPDLVVNAVEELLRFDSPVQTDGRRVLENLEIRGRRIRRGDQLVLLLGAANHDPDVFLDPGRLDLGRDNTNHLSFARGIHYCLGSPLARLEGQIAFRKLLERFADIRLAETPQFRDHIVLRGVRSLHVDVVRAPARERAWAVVPP